ncbi:hypothetical protein Pla52o_55720 [Novipirellula galeiformis]|uniref:Carboxypeptidase regulatory-like domain-containing protein n=1 Tax=Novipirellula galeiformis TaxID=2528004 RepID=A0A5C6BSV1_9BACT|nr:hypothetical protein [Novipirellula galeiformis]TWU15035.1 hypothetical protein Pla52o_55720 [Novipirellula galeiformis]
MNKNVVCFAGLFLVLPLLVGCPGGSGLDLQPVSGTVTYDGAPLKDGRIQFRSLEGDQRSFSGPIENGRYSVETFTGPMQVEIRASRIVPGLFDESNPGEKTPIGEMYLPEKYNSLTELTADVPSGGETIDFDLTSS